MDKLNRRYLTLNAVDGNVDAYCSVGFDFTGTRERMSLTVNGDHCENKCFFVVVKDGTKFIGFYLGDLVKKSEDKYELKKECGKLGTTLYTLKDVVAVEVVDKVENKVLYQGIAEGKNDFNGKYTIVVDKPIIIKKEVEPMPTEPIIQLDPSEEEMQTFGEGENKTDTLKTNQVYKYEDIENVEVEEMSFSNKNTGVGIVGPVGSGGSGGGIGGGNGSGGSGGGVGGGNGSGGSGGGFGGGNGSGGSGGGIGGGNGSGGSGGGIGGGNGSGGSGGGIGGGNGSGGSSGGFGGGSGSGGSGGGVGGGDHDHDCKCNDCKYKIYYEEHNNEENRNIYEDFEVFSKLYEGYLRSEYFNTLQETEEQDNILIVDRLEPTENKDKSKTLVINSTFRAKEIENDEVNIGNEKVEKKPEQNSDSKKRSKSVDDFYDNFLGTKGKIKGNSFVDMINHVKKEFESIREIMSLSDEEFARRAENEYKEPLREQQSSTNTFALRGLKDLVENRVEFKPFEMQGHEVSWVQIKLNEVVGFFDNYWKLFWEPFVVDAYTENKHLLLGVERVDGKENYFFGVPAFYSMEVVNKAFDLGFELFEVVGNNLGEITDGVRGYFIKELKPTESYGGSLSKKGEKQRVDEETTVEQGDIIRLAEDDKENNFSSLDGDIIEKELVIEAEEADYVDKLILLSEKDEINV